MLLCDELASQKQQFARSPLFAAKNTKERADSSRPSQVSSVNLMLYHSMSSRRASLLHDRMQSTTHMFLVPKTIIFGMFLVSRTIIFIHFHGKILHCFHRIQSAEQDATVTWKNKS